MKSTKLELEERVYTVARLMLQGIMRTSDIFRYVSDKTDWGVGKRQVENYVKEARDLIKIENGKDLDFERRLAISQIDDLIRRNLVAGDLREVRNCIKAKSEILGLIASRFADKDTEKKSDLAVISRFGENWKKVSGQ